jgi:hypothetical protein
MKYSGVKHQPFFKINSHVHNIDTVTLTLSENTSFHKINVREYRLRIVVFNTYNVVFFLFFLFFLKFICCQFLLIFLFWLPLRYSLTFILWKDVFSERVNVTVAILCTCEFILKNGLNWLLLFKLLWRYTIMFAV